MVPKLAPRIRLGTSTAHQVALIQTGVVVRPSPVWMSKTSETSIRATITNARKCSACAAGSQCAPYRTWISSGASTTITAATGTTTLTSIGMALRTPSANTSGSCSASREKLGMETYRTAAPTSPGTQLEMLKASR